MGKAFGGQNMVDPIRRLIVKRPEDAYYDQTKIDKESDQLNYLDIPDFDRAKDHYNEFIDILQSLEIEINFLPKDSSTTLDSIYTHDPCVITDEGIILCNMGKNERQSEPSAISKYFESIDIPIIGSIHSPGKLEGGDVVWIDDQTLAIGEGYRTNSEGINQLKELLDPSVNKIISVPLPHWTGPNDCLHLMSNLSPIDKNLFLVYSKLLPVPFIEYLTKRNIKLIEVPDEEYESMGCNVLALAPKIALMLKGNPITQSRLEAEDVKVYTYNGDEISLKGSGGPTCLTRPFLRSE